MANYHKQKSQTQKWKKNIVKKRGCKNPHKKTIMSKPLEIEMIRIALRAVRNHTETMRDIEFLERINKKYGTINPVEIILLTQ